MNLSVGARILLVEAGSSHSGDIVVVTTSGGLYVGAGGKQFGTDINDLDFGRRKAETESELNELSANGLITDKGEVNRQRRSQNGNSTRI